MINALPPSNPSSPSSSSLYKRIQNFTRKTSAIIDHTLQQLSSFSSDHKIEIATSLSTVVATLAAGVFYWMKASSNPSPTLPSASFSYKSLVSSLNPSELIAFPLILLQTRISFTLFEPKQIASKESALFLTSSLILTAGIKHLTTN